MDSNHLRLKPTDLQSAPALQLRRTPNLVKNCQKSEDAMILMQASVQSVHDRNQNQADSIFHNFWCGQRETARTKTQRVALLATS